jgi:hypothetical protein
MGRRLLFFNVALTFLCVLIMVLSIQVGNTTAETITSFDGSVTSKTINFYTRGDTAELSITIPDDVPVTSASVDVSTADMGNREFPEQPSIDFGPDGDLEWKFQGPGYGSFGKQYMFHTNNSRATHTFSGAGSQSNTKIRMPKDATVSSAFIGANGRLNANTPSEYSVGSNNYLHGPAVGNLNSDSNLDFATPYFYYSNGALYWWKSSGGASPSYTKYTIATGLRYPDDCDIGDLNGDGMNDIALAAAKYYSGYPSLIWYKNGGGATPSFSSTTLNSQDGGSDVKIAKIDSDGDNDLVYGTYYNGLLWYSNNGGASPTFTKKTIDNSLSRAEQIDVGDVDGDGDLDVGLTCYGGSGVNVYINSNNGNTWTKVNVASMTYGFDFQFADIDQDGDLDCAATSYYDKTIKWFENIDTTPVKGSGNGKTWAEHIITDTFSYAHGLYITDIANDGYMDLFCTGYYGNYFYWYEASDDPRVDRSWTRFTVDSYFYYGWDCVVQDVTGDSKPDVIATSAAYSSGGINRYNLQYSYPTNPSIQLGGTGSTDWSYSGTCQGHYMSNDVTTKVQSLVDSGSPMVDSYGNKYVEFPIKVSLGSGGRLTLENLDIRYNITVTVDKNPHNGDLKTEMNELVPNYGDGQTTVFMNVHSNSPGAITLSGMSLEYNAFPTLKDNIPDKHVDEDSVTENLLDVRQYFEDDYASADELEYTVQMSSDDMSKVRVTLVNNYFVKADCSQWPNWNGEVSVYISARDNGEQGGGSGKRTTDSNVFKVIVDPVNDPPQIGSDYLQNQLMNEGETKIVETSLDDKEYFTDIEDNTLYYKGVVDPDNKYDGEELSVSINSNNQIVLKALNDFHGMKIPVRIYCNDANDWSSMATCPYQEFDVTVNQLMDDKPKWGYIDTIYMVEDTDLPEAVKLTEYVSSIDLPATALQFSIVYNVNGSQIFADIDDEAYLNLYASARNFDGSTDIVIRASDSSNYADTAVRVIVEPVNDPPSGKIIEPTDGTGVELGSRVLITGSASDPESIQEVEIRIGDSPLWEKASGAGSWQYNWEVSPEDHKVNDKVQISMRVFDGELYSSVVSVNVTIVPGTGPSNPDDIDGDGVKNKDDKFPDNPFEWADADRDKHGDNREDKFPDDPNEWDDTDHDGIGDNSDPYPLGEDRAPGFTENAATQESSDSSIFSLWWLVVVLIIAEAVLVVLLMVKKFRSKRPVPTKKVIQKKKAEPKQPEVPRND